MGCKLGPLLVARLELFSTLSNKRVAVDGTNLIFKYLMKIRSKDQVLTDSKGRPISHLMGLLYFVINMLERHVAPIIVFDGLPLKEKRETPPWKIERLVNQWKRHFRAIARDDVASEQLLFRDPYFLFQYVIADAIELLKLLGVPTCRAPSDAEAQCARLVQEEKAFATLSHDHDALLFGSTRMIYDFNFKENWFKYYSLPEMLHRWKISRSQLIDVALLIGTDFNEGVKGIGPKKGVKALRTHGTIETLKSERGLEITFTPDHVRDRFLNPVTINFTPLFRSANPAAVKQFLHHRLGQRRVERALNRLREAVARLGVRQTSLTKFLNHPRSSKKCSEVKENG